MTNTCLCKFCHEELRSSNLELRDPVLDPSNDPDPPSRDLDPNEELRSCNPWRWGSSKLGTLRDKS